MPIFKISEVLKKADRNINDPSARCIDCEYPAEKNNPLMELGKTPDNSRNLFGHENCSSYQDKLKEQQELESREKNGVFASLTQFRNVDSIDNSTVEATFPMLDRSQKVKDMMRLNAGSEYDADDTGAPNPPSH